MPSVKEPWVLWGICVVGYFSFYQQKYISGNGMCSHCRRRHCWKLDWADSFAANRKKLLCTEGSGIAILTSKSEVVFGQVAVRMRYKVSLNKVNVAIFQQLEILILRRIGYLIVLQVISPSACVQVQAHRLMLKKNLSVLIYDFLSCSFENRARQAASQFQWPFRFCLLKCCGWRSVGSHQLLYVGMGDLNSRPSSCLCIKCS